MPDRLQEGELLAAVDIGSNSFHMVVARHVLGQLRVVDRLKEIGTAEVDRQLAGLSGYQVRWLLIHAGDQGK